MLPAPDHTTTHQSACQTFWLSANDWQAFSRSVTWWQQFGYVAAAAMRRSILGFVVAEEYFWFRAGRGVFSADQGQNGNGWQSLSNLVTWWQRQQCGGVFSADGGQSGTVEQDGHPRPLPTLQSSPLPAPCLTTGPPPGHLTKCQIWF